MCDTVREMSGGRLDITCYGVGEVIAKGSETAEALSTGTIEISRPALPLMGVKFGHPHYSAPGLFTKQNELLHIDFDKGGDDIIREGMLDSNIYHIASSTITGSSLITNKPVKSLADLKGIKIREFGTKASLFDKLGATVVMVPFAELYMAMQTGVVDGMCAFHQDNVDVKLYEAAPFMLLPEMEGTAQAAYQCNLDAWNELPDDLKAILVAGCERAIFRLARSWEYTDAINIKFFEAHGVTISRWSDEDIATIRKAALEVYEEQAAEDPYSARLLDLYMECSRELGYIE